MQKAQIQLFNQMLNVFNEDELRELAFLLNVNYEDLDGKNRRAKTISLVDYCKRTGRLSDLVALCQEKRAATPWPIVSEQPVEDAGGQETDPTTSAKRKSTETSNVRPRIHVPIWVWGMIGGGLVFFALLALWQPWARPTDGPFPRSSSTLTITPSDLARETAVSSLPATADGAISLNQTVSGKIRGTGSETWVYTGPEQRVDVIVEGGSDDTFTLIIYHPDGREAAYVDYSGRGEGELLAYFDLKEKAQIVIDEIENDGADYSLTITESELDFLWPSKGYSGIIRGANPEIFIYDEGPATVDVVLEMGNNDQPLLFVLRPDGSQLTYADQMDENNRVILENIELGEGEYQIVLRDQTNDGAEYRIEMVTSGG